MLPQDARERSGERERERERRVVTFDKLPPKTLSGLGDKRKRATAVVSIVADKQIHVSMLTEESMSTKAVSLTIVGHHYPAWV